MTGDSSVQHTSSEDDDEDESGLSSAPISLNASTNDVAGIVRDKIITVQVSFTFTLVPTTAIYASAASPNYPQFRCMPCD